MQVFAISVMLLWLVVATGTMKNVLYGNLVDAPCLREMEKKASTMAAERQDQGA